MNDHFVKEMIELLELVAKVMFENFISFHSGYYNLTEERPTKGTLPKSRINSGENNTTLY